MSGETWAHVKFHWFLQDSTVGTSRIFTSENSKQWQQQELRGRTHANRHWSRTDIEDIQCKDSEISTFSSEALWLWPNQFDLVKCRFYVVPGRVCCWHTSGTAVFKKLRWEKSLKCFFRHSIKDEWLIHEGFPLRHQTFHLQSFQHLAVKEFIAQNFPTFPEDSRKIHISKHMCFNLFLDLNGNDGWAN